MTYALAHDYSKSLDFEIDVAQRLGSVLDTPRALTVSMLASNGEYDQLANLDVSPTHYLDHNSFADDYLITSLLRKSPNLPTSFDREKNAIDSFYEGEKMCSETNDRILAGGLDPLLCSLSGIIARILGPLKRRDLRFIEDSFSNGPGATVTVAGSGLCPSQKQRSIPTLTYNLIPFARVTMGKLFSDYHSHWEVVEGNKFSTVPKNSKTDRGICIEPYMNIRVQKGIGALISRRLKSCGIDISRQDINRSFASLCEELEMATIDLSSASDSISELLVYRLLPPDWFELLELCRSPCTTMPDGTVVKNEKFSSMGNGYTFELETLIFYAIAIYGTSREVGTHELTVYGDDIIIPRECAESVMLTLHLCGFKVNSSKTFLAGKFFESCGSDWFNQKPVRPFFLRKTNDNRTPYPLIFCNRLREYSKMRGGEFGCDSRFRNIWLHYYKQIPRHWRRPVPVEFGDSGVHVSEHEHNLPRAPDGLDGYTVEFIIFRPVRQNSYDFPFYLTRLDEKEGAFQNNSEVIRGYLGKPRTKRTTAMWTPGLDWF